MKRRALLLLPLLGLLACSGSAQKKAPSAVAAPTGDSQLPEPPKQTSVRFAPCADRPCLLHAATRSYRECLNASGERCFHFGRVCEPSAKPPVSSAAPRP